MLALTSNCSVSQLHCNEIKERHTNNMYLCTKEGYGGKGTKERQAWQN